MFTATDFEIFEPRFQADEEWNGRRLEIRRRLQVLGDAVREVYKAEGIGLDRRESLHHPHATNGKRVRRQRTMIFRDKKSRKALQSFLGKDLGRDLDSAVNNLHLQAGLDENGFYFGLRIDKGAWFDLNVLLKRAEEAEGRDAIQAACARAAGFQLQVDGRGPRPVEGMNSRDWRDLAGSLKPGENGLELIHRLQVADAVQAGDGLEAMLVEKLGSLTGFYSLACWTLDGSSPAGFSM